MTSSRSFADGGAFLTLPMFYLEGELKLLDCWSISLNDCVFLYVWITIRQLSTALESAGIVLFPEDTLPLRVLQPRYKAAVDRAMRSDEALNTLGVIHVRARPNDGQVHVASVGTTAEVRTWV